jgi:hypothetical protein
MSVIAIIVEYCINKYSITEDAESIGVDKTPKYGIMRCSKLSIQWNIQESQLKPLKATCLEMVSRPHEYSHVIGKRRRLASALSKM